MRKGTINGVGGNQHNIYNFYLSPSPDLLDKFAGLDPFGYGSP
jgi:hypothetical protein